MTDSIRDKHHESFEFVRLNSDDVAPVCRNCNRAIWRHEYEGEVIWRHFDGYMLCQSDDEAPDFTGVEVAEPLVPGVDYDEGECMLCGSSDEHDVNECACKEFAQPDGWMIEHHRASGSSTLRFGPFKTLEEAEQWWADTGKPQGVNGAFTPLYLDVDWSR